MLNQFFDKYIFTNTLKYTHNNFYLVNVPFVISPTGMYLSLLAKKNPSFHKEMYYLIKEGMAKEFMSRFYEIGIDNAKEIDFVRAFFMASGWGSIQIINLEAESKRAIITVDNSPFASELKGKVDFPIDTFLRAALAGLFSHYFKTNVDCVESECAANTAKSCKFIIKPATEFDFSSKLVQEQLDPEK